MHVIELVEFHDGEVERLVLEQGGLVVVHFSHLSIYETRAVDLYDIVSYEAELRATDAIELVLRGAISRGNKVAFLRVNDEEARSLSLEETQTMLKSGTAAELHFDNGATLAFRCSNIELILRRRGEVIEEWKGPL